MSFRVNNSHLTSFGGLLPALVECRLAQNGEITVGWRRSEGHPSCSILSVMVRCGPGMPGTYKFLARPSTNLRLSRPGGVLLNQSEASTRDKSG